MMTAEAQLATLKIELPPAPKPAGLYKPVVLVGNLIYVSGHGPLKSDKTLITGRVGADLDLEAGQGGRAADGLAILASLRGIPGQSRPHLSGDQDSRHGSMHARLRPAARRDQRLQRIVRRGVRRRPRRGRRTAPWA